MKLPLNAKRVFKGQIFEVYQWPQTMYDGSMATFEALKRPDTVIVIPTVGKKIVISEEEQPMYGRPRVRLLGGRNDQGESPLDGAKRELLEETGMQSKEWELYKTYEPVLKIEWTVYLYIARNCKKIAEQNLDAGEKIELKEVNFDEFFTIVTSEDFLDKEFSLDFLRMERMGKFDELRNKLFG